MKDYIEHVHDDIVATISYPARIHRAMIECVSKDTSDKTRSLALECLDTLYLMESFDLHSPSTSSSIPIMSLEQVVNSLNHMLTLGASKVGQSVRGGILRLLGILSSQYPTKIHRNLLQRLAKRYTKWLADSLDKVNGDKVRPALIAGCLTGIEYLLIEHCDLIPLKSSNKKDQHDLWTVFKIFIASTKTINISTRYAVAIAAMNLINRHSYLFLTFIMPLLEATSKLGSKRYHENENDPLQLILNLSIKHGNWDVSRCGMDCVESMLSSITNKLSETQNDRNRKIYRFIMKLFGDLLSSSMNGPSSNTKPTALSIRAFGQLASTIRNYQGTDYLKGLLSTLVNVSKKCVIMNESNDSNGLDAQYKLNEFPSFLEAFSSIIYHIEFVDDAVLAQLTTMIKMIFEHFAVTRRRLRERLYTSMKRMFVVLYLKGNIFGKLLESVVYRGITYSISTLPVIEDNASSQSYYPIQRRTCYEEVYYFLRGLLVDKEVEDVGKWCKGLGDLDAGKCLRYLEEMRSILFSSLMENAITILGELDLTFELKDDGNTSNLEDNAVLHSPVDMELFLNFGTFLCV